MPTKTKPITAGVDRARELADAMLVVHGERDIVAGVDDLAAGATRVLQALRNLNYRETVTSAHVRAWDATYAAALSALDELEQLARPAVEKGRELAARLAVDLEAAELAAAEAAAEARQQAEFEAAVHDEVQLAERKRLNAIETEARKRLATTGAR